MESRSTSRIDPLRFSEALPLEPGNARRCALNQHARCFTWPWHSAPHIDARRSNERMTRGRSIRQDRELAW